MDHKLDYFIERTDERLRRIETKIEQLISFKIMLLGLAATFGAIAGMVVEFIKK